MFAIIGLNYFKGYFIRCNFAGVPIIYQNIIKTKWDCLDYGGEWQKLNPNYDNIYTSLMIFFEMMTTNGWTNYLYNSMDSNLIDYQPVQNQSPQWFIFYYAYIIISFFFLLNIFISVLSDNYKNEKHLNKKIILKTDSHREFYKIYKHLYSIKVPEKYEKIGKLRKILLNVIDSVYFEIFVTVCIIANLIMLVMTWPEQSDSDKSYIENINNILFYVFLVEALLKIYVFRLEYFITIWNIFDFLIIISQSLNLLLSIINDSIPPYFNVSLMRMLRALKILRKLKTFNKFNRIFNVFLNSIPEVLNLALIYILIVFIYAVIGMNVFSLLKPQTYINNTWNFNNFFNSIILLIRITSGDGWSNIMYECARIRTNSFYCKYPSEMTDQDKTLSKFRINTSRLW